MAETGEAEEGWVGMLGLGTLMSEARSASWLLLYCGACGVCGIDQARCFQRQVNKPIRSQLFALHCRWLPTRLCTCISPCMGAIPPTRKCTYPFRQHESVLMLQVLRRGADPAWPGVFANFATR
eukprot:940309-Rhodomonas_salina.5